LAKVQVVTEFTPAAQGQIYGPVTELQPIMKRQRWGEEVLFAHTAAYTGKVLFRKGDPSYPGVMQYHVNKDEAFYLLSGRCILRWDAGDGKLSTREVEAPCAFHIPRYARHSIIAVTDCVFFEVSTPHFEDRVNVDEEYPRE
jgi:oxalate decarboxylase/phosphoglucose isomerase-like protein (cupin superfamily)